MAKENKIKTDLIDEFLEFATNRFNEEDVTPDVGISIIMSVLLSVVCASADIWGIDPMVLMKDVLKQAENQTYDMLYGNTDNHGKDN